ncbi:MAG: hypothetical protein QM656_00340 [Paracoccaceae bacterium]
MTPATTKKTGMLTMRYLLAFYSGPSANGGCLDAARLPVEAESTEDLPDALRAASGITLRWLMARYDIGAFAPSATPSPAQQILVYALEADSSIISDETEYLGAWLEMFTRSHSPVGVIAIQDPRDASQSSMAKLRERAGEPLQSADPACQRTMDLIQDKSAGEPEPEEPAERPMVREGAS